jgi:hypothetical protein
MVTQNEMTNIHIKHITSNLIKKFVTNGEGHQTSKFNL